MLSFTEFLKESKIMSDLESALNANGTKYKSKKITTTEITVGNWIVTADAPREGSFQLYKVNGKRKQGAGLVHSVDELIKKIG